MNVEIIPSIVSRNFADLQQKIKLLDGHVEWAEIDVADGVFADNVTFQEPNLLNEFDNKIKLAIHLMVEAPETIIEEWLAVADRLIVHLESTENLADILEKYNKNYQEVVVALNLATPIDQLASVADKIKNVQLMSIEKLGVQGGEFSPAVLEKITAIKTKWPELKIYVDGGVTAEILPRLAKAGVTGVIVGSAIWGAPEPLVALKKLKSLD